MIDHNRTKTPKGTLPDFTPVPRHYNRHDGWTPERQRGFIEALADTGSVRAAAHAVNMTPEGAYLLRRHEHAAEFRKAWEAALACGVQRLEDIAMDRALHGIEVPVYSYGKLIGTRRKYNDRLLMFLLRSRARKRFGEDGRMTIADRATLNTYKRQWRKEWERERALADMERLKLDRASIEEKVARWTEERTHQIARAMRAEWLRLGGPPSIPGDEEEAEWQDYADGEEPDAADSDVVLDAADAQPDGEEPDGEEPDGEAPAEPAAPPEPEEPASHRTVSIKHGWSDDGRATPFDGRR